MRGCCVFAFLAVLSLGCGQSSRTPDLQAATGATGGSASKGGSGGTAGAGAVGGGGSMAGFGGGAGFGAAGSGAGTANEPYRSYVSLNGNPFYTRVQRLTNTQWEHAVTDILRLPAPANLTSDFVAPIAGATDFTNNELHLFVSARQFSDFEAGAEAAAALATATPEALAALYPDTDAAGFVETFGRRAFRRPLTEAERAQYEEVFALGETIYGPGFANGAALVVRAMLQSPHFLYRSELGPSGEPLSSYEMASKLSFLLFDTTPSDALLDAAGRDELATVEQIEAVARDMLEQPAAVDVLGDFHRQVHRMDRYASVDKNGVPEFDPAIVGELAKASSQFFESVFTRGEGLREIFTSTRGFAGPGLAPFYGIEPAPSMLEEVELGPNRLGYFMQVPFLMLTGRNREPDSIYRGLTLLLDVLCADLPPSVGPDAPIPQPSGDLTNRERITEITSQCGLLCHEVLIDPLGFAFEGFDGMGQERATDNGKPVDASGVFPFSEGTKDFSDARDLMNILAGSDHAHTCYAKKMAGFSLQRDMVEADRPTLEALAAVSQMASIKEMMVAIVTDPAFRVRAEGTP